MSKNHQVRNTVLALSAIIVLASFALYVNPQTVVAQVQSYKITTGIQDNILAVQWQEDTNILWALGGSNSVENIAYLYEFSGSPTLTFQARYNVSDYTNNGAPRGLYCGTTACFITTHDTAGARGSGTGAIIRVESVTNKGTVSGTLNGTSTYRGFGEITGKDTTDLGFGGITLYVETWSLDTTNLRTNIVSVGGIGVMGISSELYECGAGVASSVHCLLWDIQWSGISGAEDNHLVFGETKSNLNSALGKIINLATGGTTVCTMTMSTNDSSLQMHTMPNYAQRRVYYSAETLGGTQQWGFMNVDDCTNTPSVAGGTIDGTASHGLGTTNEVHDGIVIPPRQTAIIKDGGAGTFALMPYAPLTGAFSDFETHVELGLANPSNRLKMIYTWEHDEFGQPVAEDTDLGAIIFPLGADQSIAVYVFDASAPTFIPDFCVDVDPSPAVRLICYTDNNGDGIPDASLTGVAFQGQRVTTLINDLGIDLGLADEGTSIQANGIGYLIYIISLVSAIGLSAGVFGKFGTKESVRANITSDIPLIVYVTIIIGLAGALAGMGFIDNTLFFVSIFIVTGFAGVKIAGMIKSRGGGE